jgi:hypothetical protein
MKKQSDAAMWGRQGGHARKESLSVARRRAIARKAARTRWNANAGERAQRLLDKAAHLLKQVKKGSEKR